MDKIKSAKATVTVTWRVVIASQDGEDYSPALPSKQTALYWALALRRRGSEIVRIASSEGERLTADQIAAWCEPPLRQP